MNVDRETARLQEACTANVPGESGGPTSLSGNGARFVRTTAMMEMPGTISPTITPAHGRTTGARMGWPVSAMTGSCSVSPSPYGTARIPS